MRMLLPKRNLSRDNHKPFISKALKKEMMKRAHLKNIFNKTNSKTDHNNYKRQRNLVVALTKKEKKSFFSNIEISTDKKSFWKACKPYLSSKSSNSNEKVTLLENRQTVSDESTLAGIFNSYFINVTKSLNITYWKGPSLYTNDPVLKAIVNTILTLAF